MVVKEQINDSTEKVKSNVIKRCGDVNDDEMINVMDTFLSLRYSVKEIILNRNSFFYVDVIKENIVNASDALSILRYSINNINDF